MEIKVGIEAAILNIAIIELNFGKENSLRRLFNIFLSLTLVLTCNHGYSGMIDFSKLLPGTKQSDSVAGADLGQVLRDQGYSDAAIGFALRASQNSAQPELFEQIARSVVDSGQASVRRLAIGGQNAEQIMRVLKRRKLINGTIVGSIAAAFLIGEGIYAYEKTKQNFESPEDAMATNFARVAAASASATIAMEGLTRKSLGSKVVGLLFAVLAIYSVGGGTGQIAIEQMNYVTSRNIEEASEQLEKITAEETRLVSERAAQRERLIKERNTLRSERSKIGNVEMPPALLAERERLEAELRKHQTQLQAYDVNIKAGSTQLTYADELRAAGFTNVGINNDGDPRNDALFRDTLLPNTQGNIEKVEKALEPVLTQISNLTLQSGELSEADQRQLTQANTRIEALGEQIAALSTDDDAILSLRKSHKAMVQMLTELRARGVGPDEGLRERFGQFINTEDGFRSMVSGTMFGIVSILGGVILHRAIHIWTNYGGMPERLPGSIMINGIALSDLFNRGYSMRLELELKAQLKVLASADGVDSALRQAIGSEIKNLMQAVDEGARLGRISDAQVLAASQTIAMVTEEHRVNFPDQTKFIHEIRERVGAFKQPWYKSLAAYFWGRAAKSARVAANVPVAGTLALGMSAYGLTEMMFSSQAQAARLFEAQGILPPDGEQSYLEDVQRPSRLVLLGDVTLSIADPTPVTLPVTFIAEAAAAAYTRRWVDAEVPYLKRGLMNLLSPSAYSGETISSEFVVELGRALPMTTEDMPEVLHRVITAKIALREFAAENRRPHVPMMSTQDNVRNSSREQRGWQAKFGAYKSVFLDEMKELVSVHKNLPIFLSLYSPSQRLSFVERLAASDRELAASDRFKKIAVYIKDKNERYFPQLIGTSPREVLEADMDVVNSYILHRMGLDTREI